MLKCVLSKKNFIKIYFIQTLPDRFIFLSYSKLLAGHGSFICFAKFSEI